MARFILRFTGSAGKPAEVADEIRRRSDLTILDETARMLLVDGPESTVREILAPHADWLMAAEKQVPMPDPRVRVKHSP